MRIPDTAFIRAGRLPAIDPRQRIEGAPDLAVEVVLPTDDPNDLVLKIQQYLQAGARAVCVLYRRPGWPISTDTGNVLKCAKCIKAWTTQSSFLVFHHLFPKPSPPSDFDWRLLTGIATVRIMCRGLFLPTRFIHFEVPPWDLPSQHGALEQALQSLQSGPARPWRL